MLVFGSVWSDLLVLHNYGAIISQCQKVTFLGVKKIFVKMWKKTKLLEIAWNGENIDRKCFLKFWTIFFFFRLLKYGRVAAAH